MFTNTKHQKNFEVYQKVLIELKCRAAVRNEECTFTAIQLRTKFKKSVAECKKAAMMMKTSSGIKRFQDERGYGLWFNQLFSLVKTRDSCQPEQAIEPSLCATVDSPSSSSTSSDQQGLFVPMQGKRKKPKKESQFGELINMMKSSMNQNPVTEFINYAREEAERSRQHELKLIQLRMGAQAPTTATATPQQFVDCLPDHGTFPQHPGTPLDNEPHIENYKSYYQF